MITCAVYPELGEGHTSTVVILLSNIYTSIMLSSGPNAEEGDATKLIVVMQLAK